MADYAFGSIVEEVLEYAQVSNRHQKMALLELAFLQEALGIGFLLSKDIIRERVRFPNRDRNFRRVVEELVREGHVVCDQDQRYSIVHTWSAS